MSKKITFFLSLGVLTLASIAFVQTSSLFAKAIENPPVISTEKIYEGIGAPVDIDFTGIAGDERVFATELGGSVRINGVNYNTPFLDITEKVEVSSEKGMLGMTFDPNFEENKHFYLYYTGPTSGDGSFTVFLERYTVSDEENFADEDSGLVILQFTQRSPFHNGGSLAFGPDGYLYIGVGDDTNADSVQDLNSLNGKILRIDVSPEEGDLPADCDAISGNYAVPSDNPFVDDDGCGEIWALGFRNPWRFNFDTLTGDLYIGDVGDERTEELSYQPASSEGGENYGWPYFEGSQCHDTNFSQAECDAFVGHTPPIFEYPHSEGGGSITGGFVYRGSRYPRLYGHFIFGDFTNSQLWTTINDNGTWETIDQGKVNTTVPLLSAFGQNPAGEVFAVSFTNGETGSIHRVVDEYGFLIDLLGPESVELGETITYQLVINNVGSATQENVVVLNRIPDGANHVSGGLVSGPNVFLPVAEIAAGETVTVEWTAEPTAPTVVNDTFSVSVGELPEIDGDKIISTTTGVIDTTNLITGRFFVDADRDGILGEAETGVQGISLNLWKDAECDGEAQTNPATDFVETTQTDENGSYTFAVADISICYLVQFDTGTVPSEYESTHLDAGNDDTVDSDFYWFGWTEVFTMPTPPQNAGFYDPEIHFYRTYLPAIR